MSKQPYTPIKPGPQQQFKGNDFRAFLTTHASRILWQRSRRCPCVVMGSLKATDARAATGQPVSDCVVCFGLGYTYDQGREIRAVALGASSNETLVTMYGQQTEGMLSVTRLPEDLVSEHDRLTLLDSVRPVSELRIRTGAVERLRYPITQLAARLQSGNEQWTGLHILRADEQGRAVPVPLAEGVDYRRTEAGELEWLSAAAVQAEGTFAVSGQVPGTLIPSGSHWVTDPASGHTVALESVGDAYVSRDGVAVLTLRAVTSGRSGNVAREGLVALRVGPGSGGMTAVSQDGLSGGAEGNTPAVGERYSIDYLAAPTYIVLGTPNLHRDSWSSAKQPGGMAWQHLPVRHTCWLETLGEPGNVGRTNQ